MVKNEREVDMSKSGKKPRPKFDAKKFEETGEAPHKKEKDWGFDEIARSKSRRH